MITANFKIKKKTYCSQCFGIIEWDDVNDETSIEGHRRIKCPRCGWHEQIQEDVYNTIIQNNEEDYGPDIEKEGTTFHFYQSAFSNNQYRDSIKTFDLTVPTEKLPTNIKNYKKDYSQSTTKLSWNSQPDGNGQELNWTDIETGDQWLRLQQDNQNLFGLLEGSE